MNSFLIAIGAALVLALTAALVGPQFVDWNGYRAAIEEEGARVARRPIEIVGDVEVRLLPEPVVRAAKVRLLREEGGAPLMTAESIDLSLDLASFILGRIEIVQLTLVQPELRLEVLADGNFDLGTLPQADRAQSTLAAILRKMTARDARLVYDDPVSGGERSFDHIDLTVTSSAVTGPFKLTGAYGPTLKGDAGDDDNRPTFSVTLGVLKADRPAKVSGRVEFGKAGQLSFDGALGAKDGVPRFTGKTRLERRFAEEPVLANSEEQPPDAAILVVEAASEFGLGGADLDDLEVAVSQGLRAVSLTGSARLVWDEEPRFAVDLSTRQLDLDSLLDGGEADALVSMVSDLAADLEALVRDETVSGRASLQIGGAILRDELIRDLALALKTTPETLTISSLSGRLPGQSTINLSGELSLADDSGFVGEVVLDTLEANRLIAWAAPEQGRWLEKLFASARGKLSLRSRLEADDGAINLSGLTGLVNANPFSGDLDFQTATGTPLLRAALRFDSFDLDRYLPADATPAMLLPGGEQDSDTAALRPDLELDLSAKRLLLFGREAANAALRADVTGDVIEIETVAIDRFAGARLSGEGRMVVGADVPDGNVQLAVEAEDFERLASALHLPMNWLQDMPLPLSLESGALTLSAENQSSGSDPSSRIVVEGMLAGTTVDIDLGIGGSLSDLTTLPIELAATFAADEAPDLVGPAGLITLTRPPDSTDALSVHWDAKGILDQALQSVVTIQGLGGTLSWIGTIDASNGGQEGEAELSIADARPVLPMLGLTSDRLDDPLPVSISGSVRLDDELFALDMRSGTLAGSRLGGSLTAKRTGDGLVTVHVDAGNVSLTPVVAAAFAQRDGTAAGIAAPRASVWGTSLIDAGILKGAPILVTGAFDRLRLISGLALGDAEVKARRTEEGFEVETIAGSLGDGNLTMSGSVNSVDHALVVAGRATFDGVPLLGLIFDGSGRDLMRGTSDGEIEFSASGRSMLSLVSSIAATGSVRAADTEIARIDAADLFARAADGEPVDELRSLLVEAGESATRLGAVEGPISASSGRFRIGSTKLETGDLIGESTTFVDVPSRRFDQEIVLYTSPAADAMHFALIHAGPFDAIEREVELTALPGGGAMRWVEPELPEPVVRAPLLDKPEVTPPDDRASIADAAPAEEAEGIAANEDGTRSIAVAVAADPDANESDTVPPVTAIPVSTGSTTAIAPVSPQDQGSAETPDENDGAAVPTIEPVDITTEQGLVEIDTAAPLVMPAAGAADIIPPVGLIDTQVIDLPMPGAGDAG